MGLDNAESRGANDMHMQTHTNMCAWAAPAAPSAFGHPQKETLESPYKHEPLARA